MSWKCKFIHTNLHHSKAATALLSQKLATGETDVALIQEPWVWGPNKRLMQNKGNIVFCWTQYCSYNLHFFRNTIHVFSLSELCSRDVITVRCCYLGIPPLWLRRTTPTKGVKASRWLMQ
jgi:hypothetical protein